MLLILKLVMDQYSLNDEHQHLSKIATAGNADSVQDESFPGGGKSLPV